jgi:hypothetical protein
VTPEEIQAEVARAMAAGEVVLSERQEALVLQFWRWAAWACPDGIPPGFTEEERPK